MRTHFIKAVGRDRATTKGEKGFLRHSVMAEFSLPGVRPRNNDSNESTVESIVLNGWNFQGLFVEVGMGLTLTPCEELKTAIRKVWWSRYSEDRKCSESQRGLCRIAEPVVIDWPIPLERRTTTPNYTRCMVPSIRWICRRRLSL